MPGRVALNDRAHGGDARVFTLQEFAVRYRLEAPHLSSAELRRAAARHQLEHSRKLDDA